MRVLWVATYPELGASSRYRVCQFLPGLRELGVESTFLPFMSNAFFQGFYAPGRKVEKAATLLASALKRLRHVLVARRHDVVVVQREAAIIGPPFFELLTRYTTRVPVVFDLDDPIFIPTHETKQRSAHGALARLLKDPKKADRIARVSREIVVANDFAADWARGYTDRVTVIPTVVDPDVFRPAEGPAREIPVIGWVGSHSAAPQLEVVFPALERLAQRHRFELKLVGAGRDYQIPGVKVHNLPWSLDTEVDDFRNLDIGLCPLFEDQWSRGKPGFKPMIYMACGVAQVCTPLGRVTEALRDGEAGFFARTTEEWEARLEVLLTDAALRRRMGEAGRRTFLEGPNMVNQTPRLYEVLARAQSG
ncbi:MAG: glycosyltransferase family 4 protein [Myxococcales bacterium]|nr:glycosyltransferase family 4 protein [Myxococcales bacterium]